MKIFIFEKKLKNFEKFWKILRFLKILTEKSIFLSKIFDFQKSNLLKIFFQEGFFENLKIIQKFSKIFTFFRKRKISKSFFSTMKKYFWIIFEVLKRSMSLLSIALQFATISLYSSLSRKRSLQQMHPVKEF